MWFTLDGYIAFKKKPVQHGLPCHLITIRPYYLPQKSPTNPYSCPRDKLILDNPASNSENISKINGLNRCNGIKIH